MSGPKGKYPTVGNSFSTEHEAMLLLQTLLPADWLWRTQTPDFFVDFHIEVVERGQLAEVLKVPVQELFPPRTPGNRLHDFMEKLETTRV